MIALYLRHVDRYFAGPGPYGDGDQVLLRFDSDPRTHHAAAGATYIAVGGTWAPDSGGYLGGLVRHSPGYQETSAADAHQLMCRIAVDIVDRLSRLERGEPAVRRDACRAAVQRPHTRWRRRVSRPARRCNATWSAMSPSARGAAS